MTGLEFEMSIRGVKVIQIAKILNISNYQAGQKIKYNKFTILQAKKLIEFFNMKFEDLFYEKC